MTAKSSNSVAKNHGILAESFVSKSVGIEVQPMSIFDVLNIGGAPMEIKSCQLWVTDKSNSKNRRRGRFVFNAKQHSELVKNDGYYFFCLIDEHDEICACKCVPAAAIYHPTLKNDSNRSVSLTYTHFMECIS